MHTRTQACSPFPAGSPRNSYHAAPGVGGTSVDLVRGKGPWALKPTLFRTPLKECSVRDGVLEGGRLHQESSVETQLSHRSSLTSHRGTRCGVSGENVHLGGQPRVASSGWPLQGGLSQLGASQGPLWTLNFVVALNTVLTSETQFPACS